MTLDNATSGIATAAVFSPWWLPSIADVSAGAQIALPILGCIWLAVQIVHKLRGK